MPDKYRNKYRVQSNRMPGWDYSGNGMYFITLVTQNRVCNLGKIRNKEMILSDWGKIITDEWLKSFDMRHELLCDEYVIMPNHLHAIVVINKSTKNLPLTDSSDFANGSGSTGDSDRTDGMGGIEGIEGIGGVGGIGGIEGIGGIVGIGGIEGSGGIEGIVETHGRASQQRASQQRASQQRASQQRASQRANQPSGSGNSGFSRKPRSVSSFVGGFKSAINSKIDDYIDQHQLDIAKYNRNNHFFQPNYHDHIIRNDTEYKRIKQYIINNPKNWNEDTLSRIENDPYNPNLF